METPLQTAQFELTLSLREAGDDIVGHLNYASAPVRRIDGAALRERT
ncbi:hypothetical protein [Burkholderia pseudomallei]